MRASASVDQAGVSGGDHYDVSLARVDATGHAGCAYLLEEDARHRGRKAGHGGANKDTKNPLYSTLDALNCLDNFGRTAAYSESLEVTPGVSATFLDAGHILGSASIFLQLSEQGRSTSVLFSGDLGNAGRQLLRSPATPPRAENVVMETTYGDRLHKPLGPSIAELFEAINETFKRGGNVIIPTFAVERAQELLYFLGEGIRKGQLAGIDASVPRFANGDFGH